MTLACTGAEIYAIGYDANILVVRLCKTLGLFS
jgi:hypothetical protein